MRKRFFRLAAAMGGIALMAAGEVGAQTAPLVGEVNALSIWQVNDREVFIGATAPVPDRADGEMGFVVRCVRRTGFLEFSLILGPFPEGKVVQGMLRAPGGRVERLEQPMNNPPPGELYHSVDIENPGKARADALLGLLFRRGTLLTNGYNGTVLKVPENQNLAALSEIRNCTAQAGRR